MLIKNLYGCLALVQRWLRNIIVLSNTHFTSHLHEYSYKHSNRAFRNGGLHVRLCQGGSHAYKNLYVSFCASS